VLLELALVGLAGTPRRQLEVLRGLGEVGADPLASLLALLALAAEGLAAYLLVVLTLQAVASLPGAAGRLAHGATLLVAPAAVRRALDVLVGGALLAQSTLAPLPRAGGDAPNPTRPVVAAVLGAPARGAGFGAPARAAALGQAAFVVQTVADPEGSGEPRGKEGSGEPRSGAPVGRAPVNRAQVGRDGVAPVPLPPWLGGWQPAPRPTPAASEELPPGSAASQAPSPERSGERREDALAGPEGSPAGPEESGEPRRGAQLDPEGSGERREDAPAGPEDRGAPVRREHTVKPHDTLWGIAAAHLPTGSRSAATIDRYWRQVYAANRAAVGADPDLIHPGTRLTVPPYRPSGR